MDAKVSDKTSTQGSQSFTGGSNQYQTIKQGTANVEEFTDEVPF